MSTAKITRNIKKFQKAEKELGLETIVRDGKFDKDKTLGLALFSNREKKKYVLSTEEVFGKNFKMERIVMSEDAIQRFSPNNININEFWEKAVNAYPFLSISGYANVKNTNESNAATFYGLHSIFRGPDAVKHAWISNQDDFKILEIGPGYGGFYDWVKNLPNTKYYGIDVNPLFECDTLYKCDGKNIPEQIPGELDVVYSFNVFQHLTKEQRTSYYRQIFLALKLGGIFTFATFIVTPNNFDGPWWQISDKDGNFYCVFFNQYTMVDRVEELKKELEDIGFDVQLLAEHNNCASFSAMKVKI